MNMYNCCGVWEKSPYETNVYYSLVDADSKDAAIGAFVTEGYKKFPGQSLNKAPEVTDVTDTVKAFVNGS